MMIYCRSLSDKGFCFLWVINSQLQFGFECLNRWGYTYADRVYFTCIIISLGLLIFYPDYLGKENSEWEYCHRSRILFPPQYWDNPNRSEVRQRRNFGVYLQGTSLWNIYIYTIHFQVNNDLLFGEVREKSRKPDEIYQVIERMVWFSALLLCVGSPLPLIGSRQSKDWTIRS